MSFERKTSQTDNKITDETIIWFGKFRGKPFEEVPAWYLLGFDGKCEKRIQDYIDDNRQVLIAQYKRDPKVD